MTPSRLHPPRQALPALLFLILLGGLYTLYTLGLSGIFSFDDSTTLDGLLTVKDWPTAWLYITTGDTGPLGRPLALASFLLNALDYPHSAAGFLYTNSLIHLLNICLLALLLLQLQRLRPGVLPESPWFAPLTALFWGALPLLASTSMLVVQRMTSLSALFVLLGMLIYLGGRARHDRIIPVALTLFGIGLCTLAATLTKENGALLPLLLLVLEFTLLAETRRVRFNWPARILQAALWLPSLLVVGYLAYRLPGLEKGYVYRAFDLPQRLATEGVILWDYLRLGFLPQLLALGPFHDDYPIYDFTQPLVWLALAAWSGIITLALLRRHSEPLLAFAVFWYLVGHLLESTIIPLELYFEHRNYLPIAGPAIALAAFSSRLPIAPRLRGGVMGLYLVFVVFVLWQTLAIWGNRQQELWARKHPDSARAVQMVAQTYYEAGYHDESLRMLEETWARNRHLSSIGMQALRLRCSRQESADFTALLDGLRQTLAKSYFSYLTLHALDSIRQLQAAGNCPSIQAGDIQTLADILLANPRFKARGITRQQLHLIKARLFINANRLAEATEQLQQAFTAHPDIEILLQLYAMLHNTGQSKAAAKLLDQAKTKAPNNPWAKERWLSVIEAIRAKTEPRQTP
jgi:tetratricopeptide (TPR) repeat protein